MADSIPVEGTTVTAQHEEDPAPEDEQTENPPPYPPSDMPSNNLVGASLLNGLLPSQGDALSPLRVRRRGARRLQYDDYSYDPERDSGDLGQHSLAQQELRKASPKVTLPEIQTSSSSYLPKRLVSLRRKRQDSPIPPNLIDALTALLSPPTLNSPGGAGGPLDGIIGLGILQTPPTGLGITTPENNESKGGKDFFADDDEPQDQSTPAFPKDEDFHRDPNADPPRRGKGGTAKDGYQKDEFDEEFDKYFEGKNDPFSTSGPAGNFFEDEPSDIKQQQQQQKPAFKNPFSLPQTGSVPSLNQPAASTNRKPGEPNAAPAPKQGNNQPSGQTAAAPPTEAPKDGSASKDTTPPQETSGQASEAPAADATEPPPEDAAAQPAPDSSTQTANDPPGSNNAAPQDAGQPASAPDNSAPAESTDQPAPPPSSAQEPAAPPQEPASQSADPPAAAQDSTSAPPPPQDNGSQAAEAPPAEPAPAPSQDNSATPPDNASQASDPPAAAPESAPPPQDTSGQPAEAPADPPANSTASDQPAEAPAEQGGGPPADASNGSTEETPQARRRALQANAQSLQEVRLRRSADRMRRTPVQKRVASPAPPAETPYFSPAATFSSPVFASSPLSRTWKPSQTFSPNLYSSPAPAFESPEPSSCAFNGQPCVTTTPVLATTAAGFGVSAASTASPVLEGTPRLTQSPLMSPLLEPSRGFASPSTSYDARVFNTQAQYGSAGSQGAPGGNPGSGFYNAVIATSIVGAAMCMGAFGILAWLLFRRRTPYHRPVISHPILKYSSTDSNNGDDELEKSPIPQSGHFRQVEAPTIPESVLPSNTWRPSMQYPVDGFGNPDHLMRDTVNTVRSQHSQYPEQMMSPDLTRNMPGALNAPEYAPYPQRDSGASLQRNPSLGRQQNISRLPPALVRNNSSHEERHRARFADETAYPQPSVPNPDHAQYAVPADNQSIYNNTRHSEADTNETHVNPPTRARSSSKSSVSSQQQAPWELRKAAILASAQTSGGPVGSRTMPAANPTPVGLIDTEMKSQAESASTPSTTLSNSTLANSVSLVMLDKQQDEAKATAQKQRPISQDGNAVRNKLKKGSPHSSKKTRPVTIGAAPPSILVTNHPQALVPPPSPKPSQRVSLYSLTDTLPYLASASQSMTSFGTSAAQDDISLIDPMHRRYSVQSVQSYDHRSSFAESSIADEGDTNRCSLAESCRSEATGDVTSEQEQAKRSQRRRTLLESVYKQEEEQSKSSSSSTTAQHQTRSDDPFTQESDYQTPGKSSTRSKHRSVPQGLPPLTPPYTPKELSLVRTQDELAVETPTRRSRSVSAGASVEGPSLDASLTRFSQIDLGSEFSLSKFGSIGSLKSAAKGEIEVKPQSNDARDSTVQPRRSTASSAKRLSVHGSDVNTLSSEITTRPRRARASTISCDQFKAATTESMMTTAARVPLPNRSKATRVSFAPAMPSPPSTRTVRSIAQDLRASVNYPTGYDPTASRPTSYRTTMSSYRTSSSDYDFDHVIDFAAESARTSAFSTSSSGTQHKRKDAMSRISNGSLGVPEEDDDDGSIYSRDSGSHESPWEIAKARVRARASLALPSVSEELA